MAEDLGVALVEDTLHAGAGSLGVCCLREVAGSHVKGVNTPVKDERGEGVA